MKAKKLFTFAVLVAFLITQAYSVKVQCQFQQSNHKPGKKFFLGERDVLVPTIYDGVNVFVDKLDGFISRAIMIFGYWEPRNTRNMARFVKQGDNILNVGSHIGLEMIVLGKALQKKCRLFLIQPFSVSHNLALKNVYYNGLGDISTVYNVGVGSAYSKGISTVSTSNTGVARVFTNQKDIGNHTINYQIIVDTLDSILPSDVALDFVLIDTEGMELQVINGMKETILRSPNVIIFCEWSGKPYRTAETSQQMIGVADWLIQNNFKFYEMTKEEGPPCQYVEWVERTKKQILDEQNTRDVLIVPGHLDPNQIHD